MGNKKNVSLIVSGAGWIGSLTDMLIRALRERGVSDGAIHGLVVEGGDLPIEKIADVLVEVIEQAKNIFRLMVGKKRTTEEMVKAGKYDWSDDNITSKNFPVRSRSTKRVVIELVKFDPDLTWEEVLTEAEKRGLKRPDYEDALLFGEQHPEKQRELRRIVFLHEPWSRPPNFLSVLMLLGNSNERSLRLAWLGNGEWARDCYYAFVRPAVGETSK